MLPVLGSQSEQCVTGEFVSGIAGKLVFSAPQAAFDNRRGTEQHEHGLFPAIEQEPKYSPMSLIDSFFSKLIVIDHRCR
jgi:hypothetical protein